MNRSGTKLLNRTPASPRKYKYPIDKVHELLTGIEMPGPETVP